MKNIRMSWWSPFLLSVAACGSSTDATGSGTTGSGGASGTGGLVGSGGNPSTGGAVGTGASSGTGSSMGSGGNGGVNTGGTGGGVSPGKVSIEFTVTGPDSYCQPSPCLHGYPSVNIKGLSLSRSCTDLSCQTCQPNFGGPGCGVSQCPPNESAISITGAKLEWDGSYYATSTCGSGTSCIEPAFAKPGKYTATFCATPGKLTGPDGGVRQCVTSGPAKCGSIEFDFPSSTVAKGTVGP